MDGAPWGGSEELWAAMANHALKERHELVISVPRRPSVHPRVESLRQGGARVLFRRRLPFGRYNRYASEALFPFSNMFASRPDVICVSQGGTYDCATRHSPPQLRRLLVRSGIPYVLLCQYNDESPISSFVRETARPLFARASKVAFVAERNLASARRQLADPIRNGIVVRNPVNLQNPTALSWPRDESVRFACVARLDVAFKGHDVLFEALSSPSWQDRKWSLHLYGAGPDESYLKDLVRHFGLEARVKFEGHVSDVRQIWTENHMLLLPSRGEGTPLSMVEAMLCGRPVLATDVGGTAEWISPGSNGYLADAPAAAPLIAALETAWQDRGDWEAMGRRARDTAVHQIDPTPDQTLLRILSDAVASRPHTT